MVVAKDRGSVVSTDELNSRAGDHGAVIAPPAQRDAAILANLDLKVATIIFIATNDGLVLGAQCELGRVLLGNEAAGEDTGEDVFLHLSGDGGLLIKDGILLVRTGIVLDGYSVWHFDDLAG